MTLAVTSFVAANVYYDMRIRCLVNKSHPVSLTVEEIRQLDCDIDPRIARR